LLPAADRSRGPFVLAAFLADADLSIPVRLRAALRACVESAFFDAEERGSFFRASRTALERLAEVFLVPRAPARSALRALFRLPADARPFLGGGTRTPARRAFESPIAIACSGDSAPCLPSRM
jgi:hypothetical protein